MSSLISTLRGEIMRADEEKSLASASALSAREIKVHAEAEANVLREQINARKPDARGRAVAVRSGGRYVRRPRDRVPRAEA